MDQDTGEEIIHDDSNNVTGWIMVGREDGRKNGVELFIDMVHSI